MRRFIRFCGMLAMACAIFAIKTSSTKNDLKMPDFKRGLRSLGTNRRNSPQKFLFKEENCGNVVNVTLSNETNNFTGPAVAIGDMTAVTCDLYKKNDYGSEKVGFTNKKCTITRINDDKPSFQCVITDTISDSTYILSEGLSSSFQEGVFATTGGVGQATAIQGALQITWYPVERFYLHKYHVKAPFMKESTQNPK
uniref:Uncharacterized protein n=1 Tax=Ditylum brightwellii TaxID=49249 RepID=A0A6V2AAB4_9STRA